MSLKELGEMIDGVALDATAVGEDDYSQQIHYELCDVYGVAKGDKVFKVGYQIDNPLERLEWYKDLIQAGRNTSIEPIKPHMIYKYQPVDIRTFIEDKYYLDKKGSIYPVLMNDLIEINSGKYQEAIFTGGIGPLSADTEFLTPTGWVRMDSYQKGMLNAEYNLKTGQIEYREPCKYEVRDCEWFYNFKKSSSIDMMLSPLHRVLYVDPEGKFQVRPAEEIAKDFNSPEGFSGRIITSFNPPSYEGVSLNYDELKLQVAVQAHGVFEANSNKCTIKFKLARRKARLVKLLNLCEIPFEVTDTSPNGYATYTFNAPVRSNDFEWAWQCNSTQLRGITTELTYWSGNFREVTFSTTCKKSIDFVQYAYAAMGYGAAVYSKPSTTLKDKSKMVYTIRVNPKSLHYLNKTAKNKEVSKVPSKDGKMYCFATQTGFFVARYNGKIFITGNSGKALCVKTPIPVPLTVSATGWKLMGDLVVGDMVYDEKGKLCNVVGAFSTMHNHKCYEVVFSDGCKIVADAEHLWLTYTDINRRYKTKPTVKTTQDIADTLWVKDNITPNKSKHAIPVCGGIDNPPITTYIDPYTFGAWLGDGSKEGGRFWTADNFIKEEISKYYLVTQGQNHPQIKFAIHGIARALSYWGVIGNKHIPTPWLRASYEQRFALLQGLMDTDGTIAKKQGNCSYVTVLKDFGYQVFELVRSLGFKPTIKILKKWCTNSPKGRIECGPFYMVMFSPMGQPVFRLPRKLKYIKSLEQLTKVSPAGWRYIKEVNEVPSVPVRCIQVDSDSHLYLAGDGFIPTHNTTGALYTISYQIYLLSCLKNPHALFQLDESSEIVTIFQSISAKLAKELDYARFKSMVEESKYFKDNFPFDKDITSKLIFPNRIEVHAVSGLETAAIGQNVVQALMDELNYMAKITKSKKGIDGGDFNQAISLYESISRRRKSRFSTAGGKLPGVLCLVSSKRYPGQFTDTKEDERRKDIAKTGKSSIFLYDKRMWDVNPSKFSTKTFSIFIGDEGRKPRILLDDEAVNPEDRHLVDHIPIDFRADFEKDITNALREIAGKSTLASHPFILNTESITKCMDRTDSIFSEVSVDFVSDSLYLYPTNFKRPELPRYAHIDLGVTGDSAGLTIGTIMGFSKLIRSDDSAGEVLPKYHIDGSLEIRPPKGSEILFWKIRNVLYKLRELGLNIKWVSLDSYQSRDTLQLLRQRGFFTGMLSMDTSSMPYEVTKSALYDQRITMPFHAKLRHELASLEYDPAKGKIDHPSTDGASKDCIAGDTLIPLLDGAMATIESLVGKEVWVYSALPSGKVVPALARNIHKVGTLPVLKITLDSGETLTCTADHEIMLRDGSFIEAKELKVGVSLMPFYTKLSEGESRLVADSGLSRAAFKAKYFNHKVVAVEYLETCVDVYDMTVDGTANFAISSGIFVHNCSDSLAGVVYGLIGRRELWAIHGISPMEFPAYLTQKKDNQQAPTVTDGGAADTPFSDDVRAVYENIRRGTS